MYSTPMLLAAACECLAKAATSSASLPMVLSLASSPVNTLNLSCTCALIIGPPGDCNSSLHRKGWVRDGNRTLVKRGWSRTVLFSHHERHENPGASWATRKHRERRYHLPSARGATVRNVADSPICPVGAILPGLVGSRWDSRIIEINRPVVRYAGAGPDRTSVV